MTLQLAIEVYAGAVCVCTAIMVACFLKAYRAPEPVRTLERRQLNQLLESPRHADGSVRNVSPVSEAEWAELDRVIAALVAPEPPLARMKPISKRVM